MYTPPLHLGLEDDRNWMQYPDLEPEPVRCALCHDGDEAIATAVFDRQRLPACQGCVECPDFDGTDLSMLTA